MEILRHPFVVAGLLVVGILLLWACSHYSAFRRRIS